MSKRQLSKQAMAAMLTDKRSIDEYILDALQGKGTNYAKRYVTRYEAQLQGMTRSPDFEEYTKGLVDAMQASHLDLQKLPTAGFRHGIPTTREEYDAFYMQEMKRGANARPGVIRAAEAFKDDNLLEAKAHILAARFNYVAPHVAKELTSRGVDATHYMNEQARYMLKPAEINLDKLDTWLSPEERQNVAHSKRLAALYSEKNLLTSTAEDAPSTSPWANRVKLATHADTMKALDKFKR